MFDDVDANEDDHGNVVMMMIRLSVTASSSETVLGHSFQTFL